MPCGCWRVWADLSSSSHLDDCLFLFRVNFCGALSFQLQRLILQHKAETETAIALRQEAQGTEHTLAAMATATHAADIEAAVQDAVASAKAAHELALDAAQARLRQQDAMLSQRDAQVRSLTRMLADAQAALPQGHIAE